MSSKMTPGPSQVDGIGAPRVRTWPDYRRGCLLTYGGGHHTDGHLDAFRHGMETVFNLLEAEFPPAEQCKAVPELVAALKALYNICEVGLGVAVTICEANSVAQQARAALAKAGVVSHV